MTSPIPVQGGQDGGHGDAPSRSESAKPYNLKSITEAEFWKFDSRIRLLLKSYGYTPVNDLVTSIHAAARDYYGSQYYEGNDLRLDNPDTDTKAPNRAQSRPSNTEGEL